MIGRSDLLLAIVVLAVLLVGLLVVLVVSRAWRAVVRRRRSALREEMRPGAIAAAAGHPGERPSLGRTGAVVLDELAVELVPKVRGDARASFVQWLDPTVVARARRNATRRGPVRRARAIELLGWFGTADDLPRLVAALRDRDPLVRSTAARALGHLGDSSCVPHLLACADGPTVSPATLGVAVLGFGGAATPQLLRALDDSATGVRSFSVEVLGLLGAVEATERLVVMLRADPSAEVRLRCVRALGRIASPHALDPLCAVLGSAESVATRAVAARALGHLGSRSAVPLLDTALDDDPQVAANAARALVALAPEGPALLEAVARGTRPGAHAAAATLALHRLATARDRTGRRRPQVVDRAPSELADG